MTLTMEDVIGIMDKNYELCYVDYRDSFDENLAMVQEAIQKQDISVLDESIDDWFIDSQYQSLDFVIDELKKELESDYEKDEIEDFFDEHMDEIREEIFDRDNSYPITDLLRNTDEPATFYDLDTYIENCDYDPEGLQENLNTIKETFKITDDKYDKKIIELINEAFYGGRLVVYFNADILEMINSTEYNTIQFKNPCIAVIDTFNGSGSDIALDGLTVDFPYNPKNVFLDKNIKYNYTYEVCGMYSSWCQGTGVKFLKKDEQKNIGDSSLHDEIDREERFKKTFKDGGCSNDDNDMKRHRKIVYINEFPCGWHCKDCGRFWID